MQLAIKSCVYFSLASLVSSDGGGGYVTEGMGKKHDSCLRCFIYGGDPESGPEKKDKNDRAYNALQQGDRNDD